MIEFSDPVESLWKDMISSRRTFSLDAIFAQSSCLPLRLHKFVTATLVSPEQELIHQIEDEIVKLEGSVVEDAEANWFVFREKSATTKFFCLKLSQPNKDDLQCIVGIAASNEDAAAIRQELLMIGKLWLMASRMFEHGLHYRELAQEQATIIEHISDGVLVVGSDLRVKHLNAAAGRILQIEANTSVGMNFADLLDFEPIIKPIVESGVGYIDRELIISSPKRNLHLLDTAIPIKDQAGRVVSIVNSFREIERVRKMAGKFAGNHARYCFEDIVGRSQDLQKSVASARRAALGFSNVMLYGPSGVGKEIFAQSIHNASSRAKSPFVAINCAALPRDLIESELFGYVAGSFTGSSKDGRVGKFEAASGGTIFLDEISELPLEFQGKLLRVLQEREVVRIGDNRPISIDVRIIAASNRDLKEMARSNQFRLDLYYRCHVIGIDISALKDRKEDIPDLVNHFLGKFSNTSNQTSYTMSSDAMNLLVDYDWPGNVRELENVVENLSNFVDGGDINRDDVAKLLPILAASEGSAAVLSPLSVSTLKEVEAAAVRNALLSYDFNVTKAARGLGISKPSLYSKIKEYGIELARTSRRKEP